MRAVTETSPVGIFVRGALLLSVDQDFANDLGVHLGVIALIVAAGAAFGWRA